MAGIWIGLAIILGSESATIAQVEPFWSWNTPICWSAFILFADSIVFRARGRSRIRSAPRELAWLALLSIPLWLVFEGYNQFIDNWYYVNLPENPVLRYFGYAWSFATIWPAIFEGADLFEVWRETGNVRHETTKTRKRDQNFRGFVFSWLTVGAGVVMLVVPLLVPYRIAQYLAAPVWLGFIFLFDPINARLGGESFGRDLLDGNLDRVSDLLKSGLLCGFLWEFWNYWSRAKWHYTVPIMEHTKLFEMPLPGFLGFPAFALECFTMYEFVRLLFLKGGIVIGAPWRLERSSGRSSFDLPTPHKPAMP